MNGQALIRPIIRPIVLLLPLLLPACADHGPLSPAQATRRACEQQADRVFLQQHRDQMSERDTRDTPFADHEITGITSAGLGERFGRDQMVADCLSTSAGSRVPGAASAPVDMNAGSTMSPDAPIVAPPGFTP